MNRTEALQDYEIKNLLTNWHHLTDSPDDMRRILYQALHSAFSEIQRLRKVEAAARELMTTFAGEWDWHDIDDARTSLRNTLES